MSAQPQKLHVLDGTQLTCNQLAAMPKPAVLIWSFHTPLAAPQLDACKAWLPAQLFSSPEGLPIFYAAPLLSDRR
jgi:hypothetical protein